MSLFLAIMSFFFWPYFTVLINGPCSFISSFFQTPSLTLVDLLYFFSLYFSCRHELRLHLAPLHQHQARLSVVWPC
jgi:hypothetical protein